MAYKRSSSFGGMSGGEIQTVVGINLFILALIAFIIMTFFKIDPKSSFSFTTEKQ